MLPFLCENCVWFCLGLNRAIQETCLCSLKNMFVFTYFVLVQNSVSDRLTLSFRKGQRFKGQIWDHHKMTKGVKRIKNTQSEQCERRKSLYFELIRTQTNKTGVTRKALLCLMGIQAKKTLRMSHFDECFQHFWLLSVTASSSQVMNLICELIDLSIKMFYPTQCPTCHKEPDY